MGNCTSNDAAPVRLTEDTIRRREIRRQRSDDDLRAELRDYHTRPTKGRDFEAVRPAPLAIANAATKTPHAPALGAVPEASESSSSNDSIVV